jgi:hypothetical protein
MRAQKLNPRERAEHLFNLFNNLVVLLMFLLLIVTSCHSTKEVMAPNQTVEVVEDEDSTTYELIVLDPRFESFLASQPSPIFYSQEYYENWNNQYVLEWNQRYRNPMRYGSFYETEIDYQPFTDYGMELNYRLYYYFQFIKKEYGIVLINRGR